MCDIYCWHDPEDTAAHESLRAIMSVAWRSEVIGFMDDSGVQLTETRDH